MSAPDKTRRYHSITIDHPGQRERENGAQSKITLQVLNTRDKIESVPLSEDDLLRIIAEASRFLLILRKPWRG